MTTYWTVDVIESGSPVAQVGGPDGRFQAVLARSGPRIGQGASSFWSGPDLRRQPGAGGALQPLDRVPVGTHGHHLGAVRRVGGGVEQGLQVGARAGHQDHQPRHGR